MELHHRPRPGAADGRPLPSPTSATDARARALAMLADERLTGMRPQRAGRSSTDLLAPAQAAQAAQRRYEQRGGRRRRAPGAGSRRTARRRRPGRWSPSSICARSAPRTCCPTCWGSTRTRSARRSPTPGSCWPNTAARSPRPRCASPPPDPLTRFASGSDDLPTRSAAARPAGRPGPDRHDARRPGRADRADRARAGRPHRAAPAPSVAAANACRAPAAASSRQKITDAERVLATVLYQRKPVHPRHPRRAVRRQPRAPSATRSANVGPILAQDGYIAAPAGKRFATAAALLASLNRQQTPRHHHVDSLQAHEAARERHQPVLRAG